MWVLILAGSPSLGCLPALAADTSSFQPSRGLAELKATWTPPEPLKCSYFSIPQKNAGINPARPSPTRRGRSSFPRAAPRLRSCCKEAHSLSACARHQHGTKKKQQKDATNVFKKQKARPAWLRAAW